MNNQKKNVVLIVILSIVGVLVLLGVGIFIGLKMIGSGFSLKDTSWIGQEGSEMIFTADTLKWYQTEGSYDDNYYSGTYKLYKGKDAVKYITQALASYGVTEVELKTVFEGNDLYDESNFIVIDVNYEYTLVNGVKNTPTNAHTPYFGFVLQDGTYLDIANMNTGSYLGFTKK